MKSVFQMLMAGESAPLNCLCEIWGVKPPRRDDLRERALKTLSEAMLDPARMDRVWALLSDKDRGALQTLLGAHGGSTMLEKMFTALYGAVRDLGEGGAEREQPHLDPENVTEALFYRGLIGRGFDLSSGAARRLVYVPTDMIGLLIGMKTSYHDLPPDAAGDLPPDADAEPLAVEVLPDRSATQPADTALVDDMTTLLAYVQLRTPTLSPPADGDTLETRTLDANAAAALQPHLLHENPARFTFLFQLAAAADLIIAQDDKAFLKRAEARRWLGMTRAEQVKALAEAWRGSARLLDLASVPGLRVNRRAGTLPNLNPATARATALDLLAQHTPRDAWWDIDSFIHVVRQVAFAYQRPNADFSSWYIQNENGVMLMGAEYWDEIDGALLEYLIAGPLHWLGLVDLSDDAARLTAYGRGLMGVGAFPTPADPVEKIMIGADGTLLIARKIARIDRFTAARFATWGAPADLNASKPYTYRIEMGSLRRAHDDGINAAQIAAFLARTTTDGTLPPTVAKLLESAQLAPSLTASIERAVVVRTTTKATLDYFYETPELRRFFGARLGDLAAVVRADQLQAAQDALVAHGVHVEWLGG
ncbi:MAG: hypothetical protein SGI73_02740 [Chloroflexota bacterium]|nr:hypothetical protein [Chloroflexota bacterium]